MTYAKMSLLLIGLVAAVWSFIPAQYSRADSVRTETKTWSSSSGMNAPQAESEYHYKREQSETHVGTVPGDVEKKTEVEETHRSDGDLGPPATNEYQYNSESRESTRVAPPTVVERDRTIVEREVPATPKEGRLQGWWHRNIHRGHTDQ